MPAGMEPTETVDAKITVVVLEESGGRDRIHCVSFEEAIKVVKEQVTSNTFAKIENREGVIVFDSQDMDIENWENEWSRAKRQIGVDVEEYDCPYESVGCVADDLCVQCKMDAVQNQFKES